MKPFKIAFLIIFSAILIIIISLFSFLKYWSSVTGTNFGYWPKLIYQAFFNPPPSNLTFLILGQDPREDALEVSQTTDTIILGRLSSNNINLVSLPRDLWDLQSNTRINRLYWNKTEAKLSNSELWQSLSLDFQRITSQAPQKQIVITTSDLVNITKIIGPIEVFLDYDFVDSQYPNPQYVSNPSPSVPVYITIRFNKGKILITPENILPFVRSRKGSDTALNGGTDLGRIARQQLLISSISNHLMSLTLPEKLRLFSRLYAYFHQHIASNITDSDIASVLKAIALQPQLTVHSCTLPVYPENPSGIIYNPKYFKNNAWVYLPRQNDYAEIHQFVSKCLAN